MNVMFGISRRIPLDLSGLDAFICFTQAKALIIIHNGVI
jgi:hypothetical protein